MGFDVIGTARSSEEAEDLLEERDAGPDHHGHLPEGREDRTGTGPGDPCQATHPDPLPHSQHQAGDRSTAIHELKDCHYLSKPINSDSLEDMLQRFAQRVTDRTMAIQDDRGERRTGGTAAPVRA